MRLPDVNVLVYSVNRSSIEHARARDWLEAAFASPAGVGLSWIALLGFVRISTRRGLLPQALEVADALSLVRDWLEAPRARVLHPTATHGPLLARLLLAAGTAGNLVADAHLAALAIEHGATLGSFDRDFDRFPGLAFERLRV